MQFPGADLRPVKHLGWSLFAKIVNRFKAKFQLIILLKYSLTKDFIFSFCLGLVTKLNNSALGVLRDHYILK